MPNPKVALETLGCKVNQFESSYLIEELERAGYRIVPYGEVADIYVVHSCAVTAKACYQTRQMLRRGLRRNPRARIVAAGCNAQLEPERFVRENLATHVLGSVEKLDMAHWLDLPGTFSEPVVRVSESRQYGPLQLLNVSRMLGDRARAFLKVQDGCDAFCTYCVVPLTRGRSRSLKLQAVHDQLSSLLETGYQEIVLTGIHLGQWGKDLSPPMDLPDLIDSIEQLSHPVRLRLSSLEPKEWTKRLMDRLPAWSSLCPHFHIPLQSGDADILKRMGRPYTPSHYRELLLLLHSRFPNAALGADVMVGFPGESPSLFANTYQFIEQLPLSYLHVFPYSPRPGTPAGRWNSRATGDALKERVRSLRSLGERKRIEFQRSQLGRRVNVLVESADSDETWKGTSENYLQVKVRSSVPLEPRSIVRVQLHEWTRDGLIGIADFG